MRKNKINWKKFSEKKSSCIIAANKISFHKNELYSERYKFSKFCEEKKFENDVFGFNWNKKHSIVNIACIYFWNKLLFNENKIDFEHLKYYLFAKKKLENYKGPIKNKIEKLSQYKFNICFENQKNIKGYVTEKIFDSFIAGTVPIYSGCENIVKYIPKECFIDYEKFENKQDLLHYLTNMTEKEYENVRKNISLFLKSEKIRKFSEENFTKKVLTHIEC